VNDRSEPAAADNDGIGAVPENVLRRIRALLAKAEHGNTPAPEREAAKKLASELMEKYSINQGGSQYTRHSHSAGPTRSTRVRAWIASHFGELGLIVVFIVLAVVVSPWFAVLAGLVALLWTVHEYRVRHTNRG